MTEPGETMQEQLRHLIGSEVMLANGLERSIRRSWLDQAVVGVLAAVEIGLGGYQAVRGYWWTAGALALSALYPLWFVVKAMPGYRRHFREMLVECGGRLDWALTTLDKVILREMENEWDA